MVEEQNLERVTEEDSETTSPDIRNISQSLHAPYRLKTARAFVETLEIDPKLVTPENAQAIEEYRTKLSYTPPEKREDYTVIEANINRILEDPNSLGQILSESEPRKLPLKERGKLFLKEEWPRVVPGVNLYTITKDYLLENKKVFPNPLPGYGKDLIMTWYALNMGAATLGIGAGLAFLIKSLME